MEIRSKALVLHLPEVTSDSLESLKLLLIKVVHAGSQCTSLCVCACVGGSGEGEVCFRQRSYR